MPYRLQAGESLPSGLKRIAAEEVADTLNHLQSKNLYEVRKHIKKLRALLRLLKPNLGPIYIEENRRLREIAHAFSNARDLDVSLELLDTLATQYKTERKSLSAKRAVAQQHLELTASYQTLSEIAKRIDGWPLHHLTPTFLTTRFEKTNKQSRHAFEFAQATRSPEDFHEFRKSLKRELYQTRLLNYPETDIQRLKKLSSLLGDHHDWAVLQATLETPSARFTSFAQRRIRNYETQILLLGADLYGQQHHVAIA